MKTNILATADAVPDRDLLARLEMLAGRERESLVDVVAHLATLDRRPALYAARDYGSLFSYCTEALRLSEDAACTRIDAARTCRRFPVILDLLASGEVTLTTVRLLGRHLSPENHETVLARAKGRTRQQIDMLVAELAPRPDVPSSVRRLPAVTAPTFATAAAPAAIAPSSEPAAVAGPSPAAFLPVPRPIVQPTAPERYRVQFTIDQETHDDRLEASSRGGYPFWNG
jgi:hypothetical protein